MICYTTNYRDAACKKLYIHGVVWISTIDTPLLLFQSENLIKEKIVKQKNNRETPFAVFNELS